ncbi:MAG: PAC2 family protein [Actinobacteria bacterium]|nr:PAC2 family protein [Actinomycetota bacterium]
MPLYRLVGPTDQLVAPVMLAAFDGWVDAAGAATAAVGHIAGKGDALATFDTDLLYDYRSRRPVLDIVDGTLTELTWYELSIRRVRTGGRDVLVLSGPEPDFRWRELGRDVADLALRLGVVEWISVGAIPAAVAHTRPVPVLGTASKPGLLPPEVPQGPQGLLRVPAAALSVVELSVGDGGIPAVGFFAQVPHYVGGPYAPATIALIEHLGSHLGVEIPLDALPDEAAAQRQRIDAAVGADEDARAYLARLESMPAGEERIPSGDELASEIERFLRGESGEEPNPFGGR